MPAKRPARRGVRVDTHRSNSRGVRGGSGQTKDKQCAPSRVVTLKGVGRVWAGSESNTRHKDFQSFALPTELPAHRVCPRPPDAIGANGERIIRTDDCRALQRPTHRLRPATRDSTKSISLPSRFTPS